MRLPCATALFAQTAGAALAKDQERGHGPRREGLAGCQQALAINNLLGIEALILDEEVLIEEFLKSRFKVKFWKYNLLICNRIDSEGQISSYLLNY